MKGQCRADTVVAAPLFDWSTNYVTSFNSRRPTTSDTSGNAKPIVSQTRKLRSCFLEVKVYAVVIIDAYCLTSPGVVGCELTLQSNM